MSGALKIQREMYRCDPGRRRLRRCRVTLTGNLSTHQRWPAVTPRHAVLSAASSAVSLHHIITNNFLPAPVNSSLSSNAVIRFQVFVWMAPRGQMPCRGQAIAATLVSDLDYRTAVRKGKSFFW